MSRESEAVDVLLEKDEFSVFVPEAMDILVKADGGEDEDVEATRPIHGWCSTETKDRQDEVVVAKGLDFSEFLRWGWFNDNHRQDTASSLGVPTMVKLEKGRWYTRGNLIGGYPPADRVWELAKSLHKSGLQRRLGFSIEGRVVDRDGRNKILRAIVRNVAITNCPVNTECFLGDVRVAGAAERISRRRYSGAFVEVVLSSGEKLAGTPNHPVLTDRGWVSLGELDEVSHRVGRCGAESHAFQAAHHVEDVPPTLQEVFDLSSVVEAPRWVHASRAEDFHGDGGYGDVDVVRVDGQLQLRLESLLSEALGQGALTSTHERLLAILGLREGVCVLRRARRSLDSFVGGLRDRLAFFEREPLHALASGLGHPAGFYSVAPKGSCYSMARDSEGSLDVHGGSAASVRGDDVSLDRELVASGAVGFSSIVSKRVFDSTGHVYNLQTPRGWYAANGIVAHNCTWTVLTKAFGQPDAVERAANKALSVAGGLPVGGGGRAMTLEDLEGKPVRRGDMIDFADAVRIVKRRWPSLDSKAARRIAQHAVCR